LIEEVMLVLLIIMLLALFVVAWLTYKAWSRAREVQIDPTTMQQAVQQAMMSSTPILKDAVTSTIAQGSDLFKGAFIASLQDLRFQEEMGTVKVAATEIQQTSATLKALFEQKGARAVFAEFQLEELLKDAFPSNKFGIRQSLGEIGTPDAHIKTDEGMICIDAKFPLENYRRVVEATTDGERRRAATDFRHDMEGHIDKVSGYVRQDRGTAPVAYAFIPSEAVYQYLAQAEPDILRQAVTRNVIITSPSTLLASLALIRIAMRAREISERASQIDENLRGLQQHFESFQKTWATLRTHIQRAYGKSQEVETRYSSLRDRFEQITHLVLTDITEPDTELSESELDQESSEDK